MSVWKTGVPDDGFSLELREVVPGTLDVAMSYRQGPVEVTVRVPRDQVQEMAAAVDDWLFDSRPR